MKRAQKDALGEATEFGIHLNSNDITKCEILIPNESPNDVCSAPSDDESDFDESETMAENVPDSGKFVDIDSDGTTKTIRKSTFIWMLSESKGKLSSDRLKRVQGCSETNVGPNKRFKQNDFHEESLYKSAELEIGEWALFKPNDDDIANPQNYLIGFVLGFRCIDRKKNRIKHYKRNYATIVADTLEKNVIGVLAAWYICDESGLLTPSHDKHQSVDIKTYFATMKTPIKKQNENSNKIHFMLAFKYSEFLSLISNLNSTI